MTRQDLSGFERSFTISSAGRVIVVESTPWWHIVDDRSFRKLHAVTIITMSLHSMLQNHSIIVHSLKNVNIFALKVFCTCIY